MRVIFDGLGEADSEALILDDIQPTEAVVHLNGYNQADTFEMSFHGARLPISPEVIRAIGVDIYMFNADKLLSKEEARQQLNDTTRVMHGLVDDPSMTFDTQGKIFRVSGRDYTALMLDRPYPPLQSISTGRDLAVTVQDIIDEATGFVAVGPLNQGRVRGDQLKVVYADDVDELLGLQVDTVGEGIIKKKSNNADELKKMRAAAKKANAKTAKKPRTDTGRSKVTSVRMPVPSGRNYWDVVSELCLSYGRLVYVDGNNVVIRRPQSMSEETADRTLRFAYGRNLASLAISRHIGREAAPQIVASFYDEKARKFVEVKWPTDDKKLVMTTGSNTINFRRIALPPGIRDQGQAEQICEAAYHTYGRSESSVKFSTKALRDLRSMNVLRLKAGDPISVGWDAFDKQDVRDKSVNEREQLLLDLGYRREVAQIVAANYDKLDQLRRPMYTKEATLTWSKVDGISVDVDAINYVVASRDDKKAAA